MLFLLHQRCPYVHGPTRNVQPHSWQHAPSWAPVLPEPSGHEPDLRLHYALHPEPSTYHRQPTDPLPRKSSLIGPTETGDLWFHTDTHAYCHKKHHSQKTHRHRYLLDRLLVFFRTLQTHTETLHERTCNMLTTNWSCSLKAAWWASGCFFKKIFLRKRRWGTQSSHADIITVINNWTFLTEKTHDRMFVLYILYQYRSQ